jgi:hypothetical protein
MTLSTTIVYATSAWFLHRAEPFLPRARLVHRFYFSKLSLERVIHYSYRVFVEKRAQLFF